MAIGGKGGQWREICDARSPTRAPEDHGCVADLLHRQRAGMPPTFDVVVIGGGPAGLSAALMLGRCRRRVVVCDAGTPRNAPSRALHGYLTRDGVPPADLLALGREELAQYGVAYRRVTVTAVERTGDERFDVVIEAGERLRTRKVLIATGVTDHLPDIAGMEECYGRSVFHCPYCDGWEWSDKRLAVYGQGRAGAAVSLALLTWSRDIVLLTNGPARLPAVNRGQLESRGIIVRSHRIEAFEHDEGLLRAVRFGDGSTTERDALFFTTGQHQHAPFAEQLGCEMSRKGTVRTDRFGQTCVPGVFVVGDASRDVQFIVVAASEGAKAAVAINKQFEAEAGQGLEEEAPRAQAGDRTAESAADRRARR
jgi:thioredoxin reductase